MIRSLFFITEIILFAVILYFKLYDVEFIKRIKGSHQYFELVYSTLLYLLSVDIIERIIRFFYRKKQKLPKDKSDNFIVGLGNIHSVLVVFGFIATGLALLNVSFKELVTSLSIVAAAFAIILKDFVGNFISGMIIAFSDFISIGDSIKINNIKGRVHDISLSFIQLVSDDEELISIPNNTVFSSEIINYTKRDVKKISIEFELLLNYLQSVEKLESDLISALKNYELYVEPKSFYLRTIQIKKNSVVFKFQYVLKYQNHNMEREIRRITVRNIVRFIKQYEGNVLDASTE